MAKLKNGMIIKNYKELCNIMGWKITTGKSKKLQIEELERMCKFHKSGNSFIIDEIYESTIEKFDLRTKGNNKGNFKEYEQFNIIRDNWFDIGVYRICDNENNCYIGSTTRSFRERFIEHYKGFQENTKKLINNGGIFEIIEIMNGRTEYEIRERENFYIQQYKKDNYNLTNLTSYVSGFSPKKKEKYIEVEEENYQKAIELLRVNKLI